MRATGKQNIGSLFVFLSFYLIGLPLAIPVMLLTSLGIKGKYSGLRIAFRFSIKYVIYHVYREK